MIKIHTLPLGSYQTNCYIIHEEHSKTCCVIDPGYQANTILEKLGALVEQELPGKLVLDLQELTFMDSSGIAVVMRCRRRMEALQGELTVVNIPRQAARVLETAGLGRYVKLI